MKSMSGLASLFPAPVAIQSTTACRFDMCTSNQQEMKYLNIKIPF